MYGSIVQRVQSQQMKPMMRRVVAPLRACGALRSGVQLRSPWTTTQNRVSNCHATTPTTSRSFTTQASSSGSEGTVWNPHNSSLNFFEELSNVKPTKQPSITLTKDQVAQFKYDGFLSIERITTEEEINTLRAHYDRLFDERAGWEHGNMFDLLGSEDGEKLHAPQLLWPCYYGLPLFDTLLYANAIAISKQLLGETATFKGDHAILKPVDKDSLPTPWHQDQAYWDDKLDYEALGVWVAMQPTGVEDGCMSFIPQNGDFDNVHDAVLPHHTASDNPKIHGLEVDNPTRFAPAAHRVDCPLPTGGATFHHCRTLHYTGPNRGEQPRRAYVMSFQSLASALPPGKENDFYWNKGKDTERAKRAAESGWDQRAP